MNEKTDQHLLREYVNDGSNSAFAELVRRHVDTAYSTAVRLLMDRQLAEDAVQRAFTALAQNARKLTDRPVLSGWLIRTTHNFAVMSIRTEERRRQREEKAATMMSPNQDDSSSTDNDWRRIGPSLDAAVARLTDIDRDAIALRFFERKSARQIADTLGITEDAAQKRVNRAVNRLRNLLVARGVSMPVTVLVSALSLNAVQSASATLSAAVASQALAQAASQSFLQATVSGLAQWSTIMKAHPVSSLLATVAVLSLGTGGYLTGRAASIKHREAIRWQHASITARPDPAIISLSPVTSVTAEQVREAGDGAEDAPSVSEIFANAANHFRRTSIDPDSWARGFLALRQLTKDDLPEALAALASYENDSSVYAAMAPIIMELWAESDPQTALQFTLERLPSSVRGLSLQNISRAWAKSAPMETWQWYLGMTEGGNLPMERGSWMWIPKMIMAEWAANDPKQAFEQFIQMPYADQQNAVFGIADAAMHPDSRPGILAEILSIPDESLRQNVARRTVSRWAKLEPHNAAAWAGQLAFSSPADTFSVMAEIAEEWWAMDPHATATWLLGSVPEAMLDQAYEGLLRAISASEHR